MDGFTPRFETLNDIFERSTESFADRPLFGVKREGSWEWITYGGFGTEVVRVRSGLARLGVTKGDRVAIISDNRPEWAVAAYAAYNLGAAVVPMYEAQRADDWRYILSDSGAKVAFVADDGIRDRVTAFQDELPELRHLVTFDSAGEAGAEGLVLATLRADPVRVTPVEPTDVAGFVYTSGTTGNPKGVRLSHGNLAGNVSAILDVFPLEEDDRSLSFLPWAHAFGQTVELHAFAATGASTAFAQSVQTIVSDLAEVKPTMLVSVPRIFTQIYDGLQRHRNDMRPVERLAFDAVLRNADKRRRLAESSRSSRLAELQQRLFDRIVFSKVRARFGGRMRYAISGGAAIPMEVAELIDALGIPVYEGYGLSETSPIATANWPGSRRLGSVGKAIPGTRVEIDTSRASDGSDGEVVVYGHNVMLGYHNLPEENAAVFTHDGGFRTGDLGHMDDGYLFITGRAKEQYKLANGKYVVPTPIEERIALSPYVAHAMVYGDNRPFNVALVVPDAANLATWAAEQGIDATGDELLSHTGVRDLIRGEIGQRTRGIPTHERIRDFVLLGEDFTTESGMLTPTLKVKRNVVLDRFAREIEGLYG